MASPSGAPSPTPINGIAVSKAANSNDSRIRRCGGNPAMPSTTATPSVSSPSGAINATSLSVVVVKPRAYWAGGRGWRSWAVPPGRIRRVSPAEGPGLTLALAARSSSLRFEDLPDDVVELARQCLLDWFAVTLAGSTQEGPRI